ncbi:MAG: hypothetical protein AAFZ49_01215 [Cyanobacteria bacterium J06659_2]
MGIKEAFDALQQGLGGIEGSDALKEQLHTLANEVNAVQDIDPIAARTAMQQSEQLGTINSQLSATATERDRLQTENTQLSDRASQAELQLDTYRGLSQAGLRPEYEDLVLPYAQRSLAKNDAGELVAGDQAAAEFFGGLKQRFPDAFYAVGDAAGTGGVADGGQPPATGPQTVQATNGVVTGVDPSKVLSGDVQISA